MRIDNTATRCANRQPQIGGWTSYCRLAALLAAAKTQNSELRAEHERGR